MTQPKKTALPTSLSLTAPQSDPIVPLVPVVIGSTGLIASEAMEIKHMPSWNAPRRRTTSKKSTPTASARRTTARTARCTTPKAACKAGRPTTAKTAGRSKAAKCAVKATTAKATAKSCAGRKAGRSTC